MATTVRQALHTAIQNLTDVTDQLASGANSVIQWGRVTPQTPMPCVVVRQAGRSGGPRSLPFYADRFLVMVYDESEGAAGSGFYRIDPIIKDLRSGLNGASLTLVDQEEQVFQCQLDNYGSPDQFDYILEQPYRYIAVRISGTYTHDYR